MAAKNWLGLIFIILVIMVGVRFWVSPELKGPDIPKTEPQKVAISEAYLNLPPPGHSTTAAYLKIANLDQAPLTITGFDSSKATEIVSLLTFLRLIFSLIAAPKTSLVLSFVFIVTVSKKWSE